jgi:archaellin
MKPGYLYYVELPSTAITAAKTLVQVKAGAAPLDIASVRVAQLTKTSSELLELQLLRKSAAATVTSFTPLKFNPGDPASLAVGGTSATGNNASAEGTNSDILLKTSWNVVNGEWLYLPVPEARIRVPQGGIFGVKLNTNPAASMNILVCVEILEFQ